MSATREQLLDVARRAALAAGEAILRVYATAFDVQHKTDNTPVCEGDLASERIICAMLSEAFPDIPIASEELVAAEGLPPWAARFWAVDPLDGTKEFIARNGEFSVLIALIEDGIPVLGVVHGPALGVTYAACGPGTEQPAMSGQDLVFAVDQNRDDGTEGSDALCDLLDLPSAMLLWVPRVWFELADRQPLDFEVSSSILRHLVLLTAPPAGAGQHELAEAG